MPHPSVQLPNNFLKNLVEEFTDANTVGFLLAGSHARGDAAGYSDIDLMKFVQDLPEMPADRYLVRFRGAYLVCVTVTTVPEKMNELKKPETAIWAVPGIRQTQVLADHCGALTALKDAADAFRWEGLLSAADTYASNEMAGLAEEVHKLLNMRLS